MNPLSIFIYYHRHKRQALMLTTLMALAVMGLYLLIGLMQESYITPNYTINRYLSDFSLVQPDRGTTLDPAVAAQIRTHPDVAQVLPQNNVEIGVPNVGGLVFYFRLLGLQEADVDMVLAQSGVTLVEGQLPQPRPNTNEIVIPWTAAKNRNLHVGDVIGDRDHPIYPDAPTLPSKLVVSGIFARAEDSAEDVWLSFMSQEFVNSYRSDWKTDLSLLVVPKAGQKATLDAWLESTIAEERRIVLTYGKQQALFEEGMDIGLFTFSLMESIIALVAALALAGLNYVFVTQRQAEFGVLNALGFGRLQLVWRIARETLFTTGAAWLAGLLGCAVILLYLQYSLYAPAGLRLNFFNPTPWLYTLPIPVAVFVVSVGTVGWALARLDPVSIIERR